MGKKNRIVYISVHCGTGRHGGDHNAVLEVEVSASASPGEIEEACEEGYQQWLNNILDAGWIYEDGTERLT